MIRFATIFQDGMTLQREMPIVLFGQSTLVQSLTVWLNDKQLVQAEIPAGAFRVQLPPQPAAENTVLKICASQDGEIRFERVDIGEVWIAAGQSNMEFAMERDADAAPVIANAQDEHLRFYDVAKWAFEGEQEEGLKDSSNWERWMAWEPESARYFSAVAAWCALELRQELGVPVAIVGCNWGGTSASAWLERSLLEQDPDLKIYCTAYEEGLKTLDFARYEEERKRKQAFTSDPAMKAKIDEYIKRAAQMGMLDQMRRALDTIGPKSENRPGALHETMVEKICGFSCRGVLWYQGESDDRRPLLYQKLFTAVIESWRKEWQQALPFLFVQLAPFGRWGSNTGKEFPVVRAQQQAVAQSVPECWMVSIMDAGDELDIHPAHKRPVGHRLAVMALGKIYGRQILCEAPAFAEAVLTEGELKLRFEHTGTGLQIRGEQLQAAQLMVNGTEVSFKVSVQADTLCLHSSELKPGAAVRFAFAWTGWCTVNLYNSAQLPASPFCLQKD